MMKNDEEERYMSQICHRPQYHSQVTPTPNQNVTERSIKNVTS